MVILTRPTPFGYANDRPAIGATTLRSLSRRHILRDRHIWKDCFVMRGACIRHERATFAN